MGVEVVCLSEDCLVGGCVALQIASAARRDRSRYGDFCGGLLH